MQLSQVWQRGAMAFAAVVIIVFGVRCVDNVIEGNDFYFQFFGEAIWNGERVYPGGEWTDAVPGPERLAFGLDGLPCYFAPPIGILGRPLAWLPLWLAGAIWYVTNIGALIGSLWLTRGIFEKLGFGRTRIYVLLTGLLVLIRSFENDLQNGQINIIVLCLVSGSMYAFVSKRGFWAGFILGLALTIKQPPGLFLIYYLMKRQWAALPGCLAGLAVSFYVIPGMLIGFDAAHEYNKNWFQVVVFSSEGDAISQSSGSGDHAPGQSMLTLLTKFLTHVDASSHADEPEYINVVDLEYETVYRIHLVLSAALVGLLGLLTLRKPQSERDARWMVLVELGIVALLTILLSPLSRKAHFVILLLPACIYAYRALQEKIRDRISIAILAAALAVFLLRNYWMTVYSLMTLAAMAMLAGLVRLHVKGLPEAMDHEKPK